MAAWAVNGDMKSLVVVQRLEIRVSSGYRPILWVQSDGAFQVCDGLDDFATLCMCNGEHVEGMIVVWVFVPNKTQMCDGFVVATTVQSQRRCVEPFTQTLGEPRRRVWHAAGKRSGTSRTRSCSSRSSGNALNTRSKRPSALL